MHRSSTQRGFTITELLVATLVFSLIMVGIFSFSAFALRMVSRNLATNRTHEVIRISDLQFLRYLHESASAFRLVNFDGTNYTDATPATTSDIDATSGRTVSTRANGVRFRRLGGGPYRLTSDATSSSRNLSFNFSVNGQVPYVPQVGDKIVLPLIAREFDISAVPVVPSSGSPIGTITVADTTGVGFSLTVTGGSYFTTAYFYPAAAFTVWDGTLRYHPDFTGARRSQFQVVRNDITSPVPFALLYTSGVSTPDGLSLRVSLEAYDGAYSSRAFTNGTTTMHTVIPTLTSPTPISSSN